MVALKPSRMPRMSVSAAATSPTPVISSRSHGARGRPRREGDDHRHGADADEAVAALTDALNLVSGEGLPPLTAAVADETAAARRTSPSSPEEPAALRSGDPNLPASPRPRTSVSAICPPVARDDDIAVGSSPGRQTPSERRKLNSAIDRALLDLSALQKRLEQDDPTRRSSPRTSRSSKTPTSHLDPPERDREGQERGIQLEGRVHQLRRPARPVGQRDPRPARQRHPRRRAAVLEENHGPAERTEMPVGTVIIAEDPDPSDTAQPTQAGRRFHDDERRASSHVAIIARSLDILAVAGTRAAPRHPLTALRRHRRRQGTLRCRISMTPQSVDRRPSASYGAAPRRGGTRAGTSRRDDGRAQKVAVVANIRGRRTTPARR